MCTGSYFWQKCASAVTFVYVIALKPYITCNQLAIRSHGYFIKRHRAPYIKRCSFYLLISHLEAETFCVHSWIIFTLFSVIYLIFILYKADSLLSHATTGLNHVTRRGAGIQWLIQILYKSHSICCVQARENSRRVGEWEWTNELGMNERKVDAGNAAWMATCWRNGVRTCREPDPPDAVHSANMSYVFFDCSRDA